MHCKYLNVLLQVIQILIVSISQNSSECVTPFKRMTTDAIVKRLQIDSDAGQIVILVGMSQVADNLLVKYEIIVQSGQWQVSSDKFFTGRIFV